MKKLLQLAAMAALVVSAGTAPAMATELAAQRSTSLKDVSGFLSQRPSELKFANRISDMMLAGAERRQAPKVRLAATETVVTVPFTHTLGKNESSTNTALYTAIDANGDTKGWKIGGFTGYSVCMKPAADDVAAMDDWMMSPKVQLEAGEEYMLTYEEGRVLSSGSIEKIEVKMGKGATVADMTTDVVAAHTYTNKDFAQVSRKFTVAETGTYNFGFHSMSDKATSGNIKICNFSIVKASSIVDPAAAGTIAYELYPKGELKAKVTYTAPVKTMSGSDLAAIAKVVITGAGKDYAFESVKPGDVITTDVALENGNNKVTAVAYVANAEGAAVAGETATTESFYAGLDNPLTPANATAKLSEDGKKVIVSWDAVPEVGENGGYVDPAKVVYYIFDAFGSYYDPALASTSSTSYEFDYSDVVEQDFKAFQITAGMDETYYSLSVNTNIVTVGTPYATPFYESFTDADFSQMWGVDPASSYDMMVGTVEDNYLQTNIEDEGAEPEYLNSQDGDNGFLFFIPMNKDDMYGLFSGKINIAQAANPVLEFFYQGQGSALDAMVAVDGGEFAVAKTIDLKTTPTTGWTLAQIDLKPYKASKFIQIELRLRAIHNDDTHTWSVPVDNIRVRDLVDNDLRVVSLKAPATAEAGKSVTLTARVENLGAKANNAATASLYRNGKETATVQVPSIAANGIATVVFTDEARLDDDAAVKYNVIVAAPGDADVSNNSATAEMEVVMPIYPTATALAATVSENNVALTWAAPDYEALTKSGEVTEDFENPAYTPLTIENFGDWTMLDIDGDKTYYITNWGETNNPYRTNPMAYQLYNPQIAGVQSEYLVDVPPHSGDQLLIGWSCPGQNDNWLISPALPGVAQTISFFARSFIIAYPESFEVLYSTTDMKPESFTKVAVENYPANNEVPEVWGEYKAALPEGTKYFAIRHTSYDSYALYLDDIKYIAGAKVPADFALQGYNVYCDGTKVNAELVTDTKYTHAQNGGNGTYSYRVSAVYNYGESRHSDAVEATITSSGVETVKVADDAKAEYFTIQGVKVDAKELTPGFYVKRIGSTAEKVVVK